MLRQALFDHIQGLDFTNVDKAGTSTMITRMTSDVNQIQSGVNLVLRLFLRSPIIVFGAMIMAFTIDVKSALVFVVAIPLLAIVVFGIMIWTMPLYKKVQANLDRVLGVTRENLTGVRVIRAFHPLPHHGDRHGAGDHGQVEDAAECGEQHAVEPVDGRGHPQREGAHGGDADQHDHEGVNQRIDEGLVAGQLDEVAQRAASWS